jgi:hypothetical protein
MTTAYFHGNADRTTAHMVQEETAVAGQWHGRKYPRQQIEEPREAVFSLESVPRLYIFIYNHAGECHGCAARKNNRKYKIGIKYFQQRHLLIQEEQVNCK